MQKAKMNTPDEFFDKAREIAKRLDKTEDKLGTLEEAIEFDKKRNYQYTTPVAWMRRLNGRIIRITPEKIWDDDEPLYTAALLPTIVKDEQGKVVAVTLTNEEHQVQEVLWEAPRELSNRAEQLYDDLCDAWQSDMEHGVKCLNEKAVDDFKNNYPELNVMISRVMSFLNEIADTKESE
jgi:hypothetical protein